MRTTGLSNGRSCSTRSRQSIQRFHIARQGNGLEVPCAYHFGGKQKIIVRVVQLLKLRNTIVQVNKNILYEKVGGI